ncbi:MAG: hypothetical protein QM776_13600 [Rhodocyclaceae bacterium]
MAIDTDSLDADELLHLAIEAANRDDHARAITYLKSIQSAHQDAPNYAAAMFFLGSEYAQIGMYDRGVEEMTRAVEMAPEFHIARFQLGLLHLTSGRPLPAQEMWEPLGSLAEDHPETYLRVFKDGLEALIGDRFDECRALLQRGQAINTLNLPLNADMQKIIDALPSSDGEPGAGSDAAAPEAASEQNADHLFLSAYRNN